MTLWDRPGDEQLTWSWSKQAFPEPLTPLMQSYAPYYIQGWAAANRELRTPGVTRLRFVDGYFYSTWLPIGLTTWEEADANWRASERAAPDRWEHEWLPEIQADLLRLRAVDLDALPDDALSGALQDALEAQVRHFRIHAHMASAPYGAVQRLIDWYLERFAGAPESEPYRLLQGQGNASVESGHLLWELSALVTPPVADALRAGAWDRLAEPFVGKFAAYLNRFGQRTHALADPASPTWIEDPAPVARLILRYAEGGVPDPYLELTRLAAERASFTEQVRARLAAEERPAFEQLLALALRSNPLTEDHAHWIDQQSTAALRRVCAAFGARLAAVGALDSPADIAFLTLEELLRWGFGLADPLRPLVAARRAEHERNRGIAPPEYIGAPPEEQGWVDRYSGPARPQPAPLGEVRGVGASAGVARGVARVARSLDDAQALQPGEVLVCPATDPNWTPLFAIAAALVTDVGGSLCHAAVVAREYRLPAVVGTRSATATIVSGQVLEVDGESGVVRLR
jgi:pyruvate,water dikinase